MNWRPYILPGLVFQSVMIGGGYATGRELVAFFAPAGPLGGILGILVAGATFALIMGIAYEFARVTGARDYRSFCRELLGPLWIIYELAYLALVVLILAVIGAAAGELTSGALGWPAGVGTVTMMALVGLLTFLGSAIIAKAMALWSVLLYATYVALFLQTFIAFEADIESALAAQELRGNWAMPGIRYASYNIALPAVLFCMVFIQTRGEAFAAGAMTGLIAIVPALLFFVAMLAHYPAILEEPVPALYLMARLDNPLLAGVFQLVVFGTFVETGTGVLHAINERIDVQAAENGRPLPRWSRAAIAAAFLVLSVYGATAFGIIDLIARGYGLMSWVFLLTLILPLLTVGIMRIARTGN